MSRHIYCLATDIPHARTVMEALAEAGITSDRVSVLAADRRTNSSLAGDPHGHVAHGTLEGINIGGAIGWLAGLGALAIPGIGLFVAAGPILGILTGVAVGASLGTLRGTMLEEMGIPDPSLPHFEGAMNEGLIVISARFEDDQSSARASAAISRVGALDIGSTLAGLPSG